MSLTHISVELRRHIASRAGYRCEYCQIQESATIFGCQVDHIISEKHGGKTEESNLAFACVFCNRYKGSDIASLDDFGVMSPLFHPRQDQWSQVFSWSGVRLIGLSPKGAATIRLLRINAPERLTERELLQLR